MVKRYRNKFETQTAQRLTDMGIGFEYETEKLDYTIKSKYIPDFIIKDKNIYIETKGNGRSFDQMARKKLIAVRDGHPEIDLRILFYSDGKIGNRRKDGTFMKQSDWAEKHGFKWAVKEIPDEWLS